MTDREPDVESAAQHDAKTTPLLGRLRGSEPVRLYLYGALVPLLALLVYRSVLTPDEVPLWLALAAGVLGISGTEAVRGAVYSPASTADLYAEAHGAGREAGYVAATVGIPRDPA